MGFKFGKRSQDKLLGVHEDLIRVMERAIEMSATDFAITEGVRTLDWQKALVASGASTTMKSRHLTGHAVDVVAFVGKEVRWDWPLYGEWTFSKRLPRLCNLPGWRGKFARRCKIYINKRVLNHIP